MSDYPLMFRASETLRTATGKPFEEITLEAVVAGEITMDDLRIGADALEMQAAIAEESSRPQLAENLRRAAELVSVPEDKILAIYQALRPGRATSETLAELATEREKMYNAPRTAALIRGADSQSASEPRSDLPGITPQPEETSDPE